ncbi:hypothetical protein CAL7102_06692 [Dulcicalothrix desertica PCC 7102]|nr:hypothetical protein CAL7102_06692 [Dulcicalothrix desertica PCC 7102]
MKKLVVLNPDGNLPPSATLQTIIEQWQSNYRSLANSNRA